MLSRKAISLSGFGFLLTAFLSVTPALRGDSKEVGTLLSEVKQDVYKVQQQAEEIEAANDTRQASRECNVGQLRQIKENTNKILQTISKLNNARTTASASQQQLIGRINPVAQQLAKNVQKTFEHLKVDKGDTEPILCSEYRDFVKSTARLATTMRKLLEKI